LIRCALTQILNALFAGDGFLGALASACVRARALSADWEAAAMTDASVAGDISQARNVLRNLTAKLAFDSVILVQKCGDSCHFVFAKFASMRLRLDARFVAQLASSLWADAIQVRQRNDRWAVVWNINTLQTWHAWLLDERGKPAAKLTLALLVARVAADDAHHPAAADDFAFIANSLNAGFDFHGDIRQAVNISIYGLGTFLFNP
jgi:hypothetical protein